MKKLITLFALLALCGTLRAQNSSRADFASVDNAVKSIAAQLARTITAERATAVALGAFSYEGKLTPFNTYLNNQLTGELLAASRSFTLTSLRDAEWRVTGEVVSMGDFLRLYIRLTRLSDDTMVSQFHTDLDMNRALVSMFASGDRPILYDEYEVDSWEEPVDYRVGASADAVSIDRAISEGDEDWFVIAPTGVGASMLTMETTGNMDTYLELFDADTREDISSDDDSGDNSNARIQTPFPVQADRRYMVKVRGYSDETSGSYGFRAYTETWSATPYEVGTQAAAQVVRQSLSNGAVYFAITPRADGNLVMETSGSLDMMLELYGPDYERLESDDDSGDDNNAMIEYEVTAGTTYYVRARGYGSDERGSFGFKAYLE